LNDIEKLPIEDKNGILYAIDNAKLNTT